MNDFRQNADTRDTRPTRFERVLNYALAIGIALTLAFVGAIALST